MASSEHVQFDQDGWARSTCLHQGGFPVLLWDVLQQWGHTKPPLYSGRETTVEGVLSCEARLQIFACPGYLRMDPWEVRSVGTKLWDAWEHAAHLALTRFCEEHPILADFSMMAAFPVGTRASELGQRITQWFDSSISGLGPTLAMSARYSLAMLGLYDHLMAERVLFRQRLRLAHTHEQEQAQLIAAQAQQISAQAQQIGEQAQQIVGLNEEAVNQNALVEHLQDALVDALDDVH
ncbi:unnamed protein product [Urochloa humidicola]